MFLDTFLQFAPLLHLYCLETNTFEEATKDWCEIQITLEDLQEKYDGVIFAVQKKE